MVCVSGVEPNFVYLNLLNPHTRRISEEKYIVGRRPLACRRELAEGKHSFHARCGKAFKVRMKSKFVYLLSYFMYRKNVSLIFFHK